MTQWAVFFLKSPVLWTHRKQEFIVCSNQSAKKKKEEAISRLDNDSRSSETSNQSHLLEQCTRKSCLYSLLFESHRNASLYPSLKHLGNSSEIVNSALGICTLRTFVTPARGMNKTWDAACVKYTDYFFPFLDR